ncbi:unnamed protein product [Prorocentrum cordatum]|uniref:Uncharacterized protein n=1 Tax=Prorocentrum cordatum TaxID=2364126 RepID=A0ABN9V9X2_9DINO|nr:unnamed protein product [Polarella glacialis]
MKTLHFGAAHDWPGPPRLARAALARWRAQLNELNREGKFTGREQGGPEGAVVSDPFDEAHLHFGRSAARGMLCASPGLKTGAGMEPANERLAARERQTAFEGRKAHKDEKNEFASPAARRLRGERPPGELPPRPPPSDPRGTHRAAGS